MAVIVFAENSGGKFKKATLELVTYGNKLAQNSSGDCIAVVLGKVDDLSVLGKFGADRIVADSSDRFDDFDGKLISDALAELAIKENAHTVIVSHSSSGKTILGRLAVKLKAGSVSAVNALPSLENGFEITKSVFSSKAIATYKIDSPVRVLSLLGNTLPPEELNAAGTIENFTFAGGASKVKVLERKTIEGVVPLPEAELVVSAGRGMKGPENWGIIEELANTLKATTACSRPVADTGWRPHHEHVGQTGVAIRPNLYIAIGISGAIQHLAGVNNSKVIVVINKDPEAPFFKAADYGVVGDLFDVVPRLTAAIKAYRS